jgi:hypothetical protein
MRELFELLTSGRIADHREAVAALKFIVARKPAGDPHYTTNRPEVKVMAHGKRKAARSGREELTGVLAKQMDVWRLKTGSRGISQTRLVRKAADKTGLSEKMIRNHCQALDDYLKFIEAVSLVRQSACYLYKRDSMEAVDIALRSQRDACAWLGTARPV